jgi:hypothetical protein
MLYAVVVLANKRSEVRPDVLTGAGLPDLAGGA